MTFEEIYRRIADGRPAACREQAEEELALLTGLEVRTPVMIAVAIAEADAFHAKDDNYLSQARERFHFQGDKTVFHYAAIGRMLLALRDYAAQDGSSRTVELAAHRCYLKLVTLEFGKLEKLTVLAHDKKRGVVEIINFMRLHYTPAMTNADFAKKINSLYGYGKNAEQLSFKFDMLDDVEPEKVADLMESDDFGPAEALQVVSNGALWCRSAAEKVAAHAGDFTDEALPEFERLSEELAAAKAQLDALISAHRRRLLE